MGQVREDLLQRRIEDLQAEAAALRRGWEETQLMLKTEREDRARHFEIDRRGFVQAIEARRTIAAMAVEQAGKNCERLQLQVIELQRQLDATGLVCTHSAGDEINHPSHYCAHPSGVECIQITEHMTFNVGNAIKNLWRNGLKDSVPAIRDLRKAAWYIAREIERTGGENE